MGHNGLKNLGNSCLDIRANLAQKRCQCGLEIQANIAWKSRQIWPRNLSQFYLEICGNLVWEVLANLTWNLGQYGMESLSQYGPECLCQSGLKTRANMALKIRVIRPENSGQFGLEIQASFA